MKKILENMKASFIAGVAAFGAAMDTIEMTVEAKSAIVSNMIVAAQSAGLMVFYTSIGVFLVSKGLTVIRNV